MAEISNREYDLLMTAINANATAVSSLGTTVGTLAQKLEGRYLTREEDDRHDERIKNEIYIYIREQIALCRTEIRDGLEVVRKEGSDIHQGIQDQMKLCFTLIGTLVLVVLTMGGWIVTHLH